MMIPRRVLSLLLVGGLLLAVTGGFATRLHAAEPPAALLPMGDGLTRDSLSDVGAPEAAPVVEPVPTAVSVVPARTHPHTLARHRRLYRQPAQTGSLRVVKRAPAAPRRNVLISFVYWWNGWVIRTFHTKDGTVLLKRIGAKGVASGGSGSAK